MEQNFETSFIPKKPVVAERSRPTRSVGLLSITAIFILFTVLLVSGGFYFYKVVMEKRVVKMENDLNLAKNRFEPAKIAELRTLGRRLSAGTEVLAKHITIAPVFDVLEAITMKTVRYTKFDYKLSDDPTAGVKIELKGQAIGYRSIALQSDLFAENKNLIDPVFSNLALDDKGNVLFDLSFVVDRGFVDYKQALLTAQAGN